MEIGHKLYNKREKSLSFKFERYNWSQFWFQICRHVILKIVCSDNYLKPVIHREESFLFPLFLEKMKMILDIYKDENHGEDPGFFETWRSQTRQLTLFQNGSSKISRNGMHYYGIACDVVDFKSGKPDWKLDYERLHEIAEQVDVYKCSASDLCHFQFIPLSQQSTLRDIFDEVAKSVQDLVNVNIDGNLGPKSWAVLSVDKERLIEYFDEQFKIRWGK